MKKVRALIAAALAIISKRKTRLTTTSAAPTLHEVLKKIEVSNPDLFDYL